jgi:hypothetical protein
MNCSRFNRPHLSLHILLLLIACGCAVPHVVEIHPEVKASTDTGVEITNRDDFKYPRVTVFVKGFFTAEVGDIAPGQTVSIPFAKFVDDNGVHFDVSKMKPEAIRVRAWIDGRAASKIFAVK